MAHGDSTRLVWEHKLEPTGTLFMDDLRDLEEVLVPAANEDVEREWLLRGRDERFGERRITSANLAQVVHRRRELVADELSFKATSRLGSTFERDIEVRLSMTNWTGRPEPWTVELSASGNHEDWYANAVRGVREVFDRASQTTWSREHPGLRQSLWYWTVLSSALLIASLLSAGAQGWSDYVLVREGYSQVYWVVLAISGIGAYVVKLRLDLTARWEPPRFDLSRTRSQGQESPPPALVTHDYVVLAISVAALVATIWFGIR